MDALIAQQFKDQNIVVLIPTYNNDTTLAQVITTVANYTSQIIVIDDGSTDTTSFILNQFPFITKINQPFNQGKGFALRTGINKAVEMGFQYAIAIDSDGQHYPSDLLKFLDCIKQQPQSLIIGARNMTVDHIPQKSSFGKKFSNFWFWVCTGIRAPDTQSGFRLYPVQQLKDIQFISKKYEWEIEVIVRAAWKNIPIISIPIAVYYPPANERISHFRPFKDFFRISVLNTFLVLIALLWIKPKRIIMSLTKKEGWINLHKTLFNHPEESNQLKATSVGFGLFMGIVPIWGFQLAIGIPLAILFRLNKVLFLIAANISIFPFTAFIWAASLITGKIILGQPKWGIDITKLSLELLKKEGLAFFLGGFVLAVFVGLLGYSLTLIGLLFSNRNQKDAVK